MNNKLLTASEVSEILRIGKSTVYAYVAEGLLNGISYPLARKSKAKSKNRRTVRFRLADIEKFLDNCN